MRVAAPGRDAGWVVDPIVRDGRALGALVLGYRGRRWADPVQRDAVGAFAARIISPVERATLFEGERRQRREAETARARLESLQRVSEAALASVQLDELLPGLVAEIRTAFDCDVVAVLLDDRERGRLVVRSATGVEQSSDEPLEVGYGSGLAALLEGAARTTLVEDVAAAELGWPALGDRARTLLAAPLAAAGELVGGIVVGRGSAFTAEDRLLLGLAADRIALAVRHAREHERERDVAITLQRSMLPRGLPSADGVDLAARYVPARERLEVGGDSYDALPLRDGRLALVIGDVAGKGLEAAAVMGQLRNALRAFLIEGRGPADALAHLDALMLHIRLDQMATAAVAIVDPVTGSLVYSLAGHPPPLLAVDGERPSSWRRAARPGRRPARLERRRRPWTRRAPSRSCSTRTVSSSGASSPSTWCSSSCSRRWAARRRGPNGPAERLLAAALGDWSPEDDVALLALRHGAPDGCGWSSPPRGRSSRRPVASCAAGCRPRPGRAHPRRRPAGGRRGVRRRRGARLRRGVGTVELVAAVDGDAVDLVVTDHGHWREPRPSTRGRGLGIMRRLVDEVDVETGADGTRVHLRRALPPARPEPRGSSSGASRGASRGSAAAFGHRDALRAALGVGALVLVLGHVSDLHDDRDHERALARAAVDELGDGVVQVRLDDLASRARRGAASVSAAHVCTSASRVSASSAPSGAKPRAMTSALPAPLPSSCSWQTTTSVPSAESWRRSRSTTSWMAPMPRPSTKATPASTRPARRTSPPRARSSRRARG